MKQQTSFNAAANAQPVNGLAQTSVADDQALRQVLGDLGYACVADVAKRTGVSPTELVRHMVREFYNVQFDVPAPHLRSAMRQSARDAAKWGTAQA